MITWIIKLPALINDLIEGIDSKISVITRIELHAWPGANNEQTLILKEFIDATEVFSLEEPIILKAIEIRRNFRIKLPDAIISSTALVNDLGLITRNSKDFGKIAGLEILDPFD